jgi:hypothetical protein
MPGDYASDPACQRPVRHDISFAMSQSCSQFSNQHALEANMPQYKENLRRNSVMNSFYNGAQNVAGKHRSWCFKKRFYCFVDLDRIVRGAQGPI